MSPKGSKPDRQASHIAASMRKRGKSPAKAKAIAQAVVQNTKRGVIGKRKAARGKKVKP